PPALRGARRGREEEARRRPARAAPPALAPPRPPARAGGAGGAGAPDEAAAALHRGLPRQGAGEARHRAAEHVQPDALDPPGARLRRAEGAEALRDRPRHPRLRPPRGPLPEPVRPRLHRRDGGAARPHRRRRPPLPRRPRAVLPRPPPRRRPRCRGAVAGCRWTADGGRRTEDGRRGAACSGPLSPSLPFSLSPSLIAPRLPALREEDGAAERPHRPVLGLHRLPRLPHDAAVGGPGSRPLPGLRRWPPRRAPLEEGGDVLGLHGLSRL